MRKRMGFNHQLNNKSNPLEFLSMSQKTQSPLLSISAVHKKKEPLQTNKAGKSQMKLHSALKLASEYFISRNYMRAIEIYEKCIVLFSGCFLSPSWSLVLV
jgi:hypothetical protein